MRLGQHFRFNNKCKGCGHKFSIHVKSVQAPTTFGSYAYQDDAGQIFPADRMGSSRLVYTCEGCGTRRLAQSVLGKYNPTKDCNDKCLSATGRQCECSCGGKNHGAGNE